MFMHNDGHHPHRPSLDLQYYVNLAKPIKKRLVRLQHGCGAEGGEGFNVATLLHYNPPKTHDCRDARQSFQMRERRLSS